MAYLLPTGDTRGSRPASDLPSSRSSLEAASSSTRARRARWSPPLLSRRYGPHACTRCSYPPPTRSPHPQHPLDLPWTLNTSQLSRSPHQPAAPTPSTPSQCPTTPTLCRRAAAAAARARSRSPGAGLSSTIMPGRSSSGPPLINQSPDRPILPLSHVLPQPAERPLDVIFDPPFVTPEASEAHPGLFRRYSSPLHVWNVKSRSWLATF